MLIKNKRQNTVWDIQDKAVAERLLAKPAEYEEVKPETKKPEKSG